MSELTFLLDRFHTPLGEMLLLIDESGQLRALDWHDYEDRMHRLLRRQYPRQAVVVRERVSPSPVRLSLQQYFEGDLAALTRIPVATGGTAFQRAVWAALRDIPAGETRSYGELAREIGRPQAVRAVGLANGANPVGVVVPCHRVIGANRSLTGYAGGLARKRWLLAHEAGWRARGLAMRAA